MIQFQLPIPHVTIKVNNERLIMHLACQFVHNVRQHCIYTFFIVASENPDIYLRKANLLKIYLINLLYAVYKM